MRKSSLGARRGSQPVRVDGDFRLSAVRGPLEGRRGSAIPQPGFSSKGSRSSSENRDSRISALQPMKRSKSQVITPQRGTIQLPESAQSQRFMSPFSDGGRSSRKSTYSSVTGQKPARVVKDTRLLTDKTFQQQEIQKITSFLYAQPDALSFLPKGINFRQLSLKTFVDLMNYAMGFFDDTISVNMTNYVIEIPLIMRKWGYVGNLNSSWLKSVNTPHALPHVLGLVSWLLTLASGIGETDEEAVAQESLQTAEDELFPYANALTYVPHLLNQYSLWNSNDEEGEQNEEQRFLQELCRTNGVSDEELWEINEELKNFEMELNDPKEIAEIEAAMEEEKKYSEVLKDYNSCMLYKTQMEDFLEKIETDLDNLNLKLKHEEEAIQCLQTKIMEVKDQISKQVMTVEERDEILKECSDINSAIRENEEYISVVKNSTYADDLEMAKRRETIKKKVQAYNKIIVTESSWLPELETLKHNTNILHDGAKEVLAEIDAQARKLKAEQEKKHADLTSQVKQLQAELLEFEERKSQVLHEKEQYSEKVKQAVESIETLKLQIAEETAHMKRTIDSLKATNEAHINCSSLSEAKEQIQKLIEKREYGKAFLQKQEEKAKSFFADSVAITNLLINSVIKAEEEFDRKKDEALQNAHLRLSKIRSELEQLAGH